MRSLLLLCVLLVAGCGSSIAGHTDHHFSAAPDASPSYAQIPLGIHDDFEAVIEVKPEGQVAGLMIRAHRNEVFEPAPCGAWRLPGLYGQAIVVHADRTFEFIRFNGRSTIRAANGIDIPVDDNGWMRISITARGPEITITLDDAVLTYTTPDEHFRRGALYWVAGAVEGISAGPAEMRLIEFNSLEREGEWRPLFNGENFDGWKQWGNEQWDIEEGVIIGRSGPDKSEGYLATEEVWSDFRVRGSFKMLGEGNFGLFYHATIEMGDKDGKPYPYISGVQGEVEPGYPSSTGWLYESYKRGWLVEPTKDTLAAYVLDPDGWNELEIRAQEGVITTWVNGVRAVHFEDSDPQLFEGSFALQLHAGGVDGIAWKDLYVLD